MSVLNITASSAAGEGAYEEPLVACGVLEPLVACMGREAVAPILQEQVARPLPLPLTLTLTLTLTQALTRTLTLTLTL